MRASGAALKLRPAAAAAHSPEGLLKADPTCNPNDWRAILEPHAAVHALGDCDGLLR